MSGDVTLRRLLNGLATGLILATFVWAGSPSSQRPIEKEVPEEQKRLDSQAGRSEASQTAEAEAAKAESLEKIRNLLKEGRYAEAEDAARALLADVEAASGRDSLQAAEVLDVLVEALWRGGKVNQPELLELAEQTVVLKGETLGPDHPKVAKSLNNLAIVLVLKGEHVRARSLFERVLTIREKAFGPEHVEVAKSLNNLGNLLVAMGDHAGARPFFEQAVTVLEKTLGPDHPDVAVGLYNLARVRVFAGEYADAYALYERVLAIDEKALGRNHPAVAKDLEALGDLLRYMGKNVEARPLLEQALEIRENVFGPDHPEVASSLTSLGNLLWWNADYAESKGLFERALNIREKVLGSDHPDVAWALKNLANIHKEMGDYAAARPLYERALGIQEKALGPDHRDVAYTLNGLAILLQSTGDYAAARPLLERSLRITKKALGPDHSDLAWALNRLGYNFWRTGNYSRANPLLHRALALHEKAFGPEHPEVGWVLLNLAALYTQTGEHKAAFEASLRADQIFREDMLLALPTLAEREALSYALSTASRLHLALTLMASRDNLIPGSEQQAWEALIRSRALVLDEMAARHRAVGGAADPEIVRPAEELASARQRLAYLVVRGAGDEPADRYRRLLDQARQEKEQAERALAEKSAAFREDLGRRQLGLEEVAAALPPDSALVAFAQYDRHEFTQKIPGGKPPEPVPSYLAFLLRGGGTEPVVVPLGRAQEIDDLVSRMRQQIAQEAMAPGRSPKRSEAAYRRVGMALRRKVWDPVASHLEDTQLVFVVPDGALHLVNLASLPVGPSEYLIETGPLIHYLSAERDLVRLGTWGARGEGLLVLGDPAFDEPKLFAALAPEGEKPEESAPVQIATVHSFRGKRSACGEFQTLRFQPLPASAWEAEEVVALWKKGTGVRQGEEHRLRSTIQERASGIVLLSGAAANEAAFKAEAPGKRVLHLATHGFFLGGRCPSALEPSGKPTQGVQPRSVTGENPLLLAGLALAGANHRQAAGPDEEDGILTAEEIAALDLSGVEWAVLSACDTGVGEVKAGEGVLGLRRAFQVAGARTLIMSLWQVEDEAVRQWMTTLYRRRFVDGLSTAESVHEASLEVLRQRRTEKKSTHPFYWAGFVAAGDWR